MTQQQQHRSLEARRAERRRRERRRRKRIRALFLLILFIAIIVFVIIGFASCNNNNNTESPTQTDTVTVTADPLALPTEEPIKTGLALLPSPEEENDLLDIIEEIDEAGGEKTCYLTFDDGPSENVTPIILDTLRRYNVKATFFLVGSIIDSNPDMARRVYEEGHLLANHSQSHNYDKLYASETSFMNEVEATEEAIKKISNGKHSFKLFRFPGGSYNAGDHASEKQTYKGTLAENGFYYVDWNSLNGDAEGRSKNASQLLSYLKNSIDTDSSAVVLMHDASAKKATAQSLASIIEYLISEGYTFKRLDEIDYYPVIATPAPSADPSDDGSSYSDTQSYDESDDDSASLEDEDSSDGDGTYGSGKILSTASPGSKTRTSIDGTSITEQ